MLLFVTNTTCFPGCDKCSSVFALKYYCVSAVGCIPLLLNSSSVSFVPGKIWSPDQRTPVSMVTFQYCYHTGLNIEASQGPKRMRNRGLGVPTIAIKEEDLQQIIIDQFCTRNLLIKKSRKEIEGIELILTSNLSMNSRIPSPSPVK